MFTNLKLYVSKTPGRFMIAAHIGRLPKARHGHSYKRIISVTFFCNRRPRVNDVRTDTWPQPNPKKAVQPALT